MSYTLVICFYLVICLFHITLFGIADTAPPLINLFSISFSLSIFTPKYLNSSHPLCNLCDLPILITLIIILNYNNNNNNNNINNNNNNDNNNSGQNSSLRAELLPNSCRFHVFLFADSVKPSSGKFRDHPFLFLLLPGGQH